MTIPDAAIEAAEGALDPYLREMGVGELVEDTARIALEAAEPHFREAIAQEIEAADRYMGQWRSARIVRGGTP